MVVIIKFGFFINNDNWYFCINNYLYMFNQFQFYCLNSIIFLVRVNIMCLFYFESKNWVFDNVFFGVQKLKKIVCVYKKNVKIIYCKIKKMQNCVMGGGFF